MLYGVFAVAVVVAFGACILYRSLTTANRARWLPEQSSEYWATLAEAHPLDGYAALVARWLALVVITFAVLVGGIAYLELAAFGSHPSFGKATAWSYTVPAALAASAVFGLRLGLARRRVVRLFGTPQREADAPENWPQGLVAAVIVVFAVGIAASSLVVAAAFPA